MFLTPESTGTPEQSNASPTGAGSASSAKKARRQTAFYPNMNSSNKPQKSVHCFLKWAQRTNFLGGNRPFSRSAAKRESVMTLGSIEHLQHYFTKTGIAAKNK
jgi:hypothetical protein